MNAKKRALGRIIAVALALILHASATPAQQPEGTLRGRVVDPAGAVIPGATVTVTDAAGKDKTTTTDGEGVYTITALPPGTYSVRATATGFAPLQDTEVEITPGSRKVLDLKLEVTVRENVDVPAGNGHLSVEPETTNSGLVLSGEDLKILSDDPDLLMEDLRALAGPGFGPNGTQFYVDGFSGGRLPPKTSIREVRINQNPFAAEQDALGFGRVEIFTKPGSGQLNGQLLMFFSDESLNARNPLVATKPPFQVRLFGANLTGPISKKASFFLDLERREIDENAFVSAVVLDPSLSLIPFSQGIVTPQRRTNLSGRVDYQFNQKQTLVARYGFLDSKLDNQGVGGFALPSVAFGSRLKEHTLQLTETAVINPRVLNETRFQFVHSRSSKQGDDSSPTIQVQGAFIGGGAQVGPAFNDSNRYELNNVTMWASGTHTVRFGGRFRLADFTDVDRSSYNGAFIFSSPEQYRRVLSGVPGARPAQLLINGGNSRADVNQSDLGLFLQDDWRVRPNFTLSYGLRFETQTRIHDRADFAPRVSFAWGLGATKQNTPKTVIRGGAGVFYYRFGDDLTLQAERFDGLHQQQLIITSPDFFPVIPLFDTLTGSNPPTVRRIAPDLRAPYIVSEAIGVERQLPRSITLSVTFVHQDSFHLLRSRNVNAPLPETFIPGVPSSGVRPLDAAGNIFQFESTGSSKSDGLVINFRGRLAPHVMLFATSRFYRERNDTDGPYNFPANSFDTSGEFSYGLNDVRAATFMGSNIILPWKLTMSPFIRATTGSRFNIITGRDTNGDAVFTERPAFATDLTKPGVVFTNFGAFDPNPGPGQQLIPRNYGRGPGYFNVNVRFGRTFSFGTVRANSSSAVAGPQAGPQPTSPGGPQPVPRVAGPDSSGKYSLTLSFQVQNLLNHTNLGPTIGNLSSPLFGQSNTLAGTQRRFDFNVRFSF
jgi:hypothetical protein